MNMCPNCYYDFDLEAQLSDPDIQALAIKKLLSIGPDSDVPPMRLNLTLKSIQKLCKELELEMKDLSFYYSQFDIVAFFHPKRAIVTFYKIDPKDIL